MSNHTLGTAENEPLRFHFRKLDTPDPRVASPVGAALTFGTIPHCGELVYVGTLLLAWGSHALKLSVLIRDGLEFLVEVKTSQFKRFPSENGPLLGPPTKTGESLILLYTVGAQE